MVDTARLARILARIRQDLATLGAYAEADRADLGADDARLGHVKYAFVTMLEGCIDAAQHVCASEGYGPPDTNADAMHSLARNGVLPDGLATAMASAVRFRNVLVHLYADVDDDVDDDRVLSYLDVLGDIGRFVAALAGLLDEERA
ncbi:MAG TPA: HepT-like ribonuclease domain-containing protein [Nitriliruptorales bacterium]